MRTYGDYLYIYFIFYIKSRMKIQQATIADCPQIVELEKRVRDDDYVSNIYECAAFINYGYVFVAKEREEIIGAIIGFIGKNNIVFVTDLVVDPEYRGQGIGKDLYQKLIESNENTIHGLVAPEYKESNDLHKRLWFTKIEEIKKPYGDWNNMMYLYEFKR